MNEPYVSILSRIAKIKKEDVERVLLAQYLVAIKEIMDRNSEFRTPFGVISIEKKQKKDQDGPNLDYTFSPSGTFLKLCCGNLDKRTVEQVIKTVRDL